MKHRRSGPEVTSRYRPLRKQSAAHLHGIPELSSRVQTLSHELNDRMGSADRLYKTIKLVTASLSAEKSSPSVQLDYCGTVAILPHAGIRRIRRPIGGMHRSWQKQRVRVPLLRTKNGLTSGWYNSDIYTRRLPKSFRKLEVPL